MYGMLIGLAKWLTRARLLFEMIATFKPCPVKDDSHAFTSSGTSSTSHGINVLSKSMTIPLMPSCLNQSGFNSKMDRTYRLGKNNRNHDSPQLFPSSISIIL